MYYAAERSNGEWYVAGDTDRHSLDVPVASEANARALAQELNAGEAPQSGSPSSSSDQHLSHRHL